jgi:hypothetical protein
LTKNLAKLGNGLTTTIKEEDVELFSASEFFSNVIGNSLDHADWGVSDVSISFTDGVDKNSMTQLVFPKLVPGNELVIGGKLVGGGESIIRAEFNYTGLDGVKEGNFVKFWNQAAARSDSRTRPHWADFSSRTVANLEIQQVNFPENRYFQRHDLASGRMARSLFVGRRKSRLRRANRRTFSGAKLAHSFYCSTCSQASAAGSDEEQSQRRRH